MIQGEAGSASSLQFTGVKLHLEVFFVNLNLVLK